MASPSPTTRESCRQQIVDSLRRHCNALAQHAPLPHILLVGPSGIGKTALARVVAMEMGKVLHRQAVIGGRCRHG